MGNIIETNSATIIQEGDIISVMARYRVLFEKLNDIGPEVMDQELIGLSNCIQRSDNY